MDELHRQMEVIAACILTAAFAVWCACDDDLQIAMNKPVKHVQQWLLRASVVTLLCVVVGMPWLAIGLAGLFSAVFRYALNRLRGLSPWYVSPSNWYDWQFIKRTRWFTLDLVKQPRTQAMMYHQVAYNDAPYYVTSIHRAGRIAYAVELLAFVTVLLMHVL